MINLKINENEADQRLDRFLKKYLRNQPLSRIYKIIRKDARLNGKRPKIDTKLKLGDELLLYIEPPEREAKNDAKINNTSLRNSDLEVVYEDDNIVIVNKPFGLLTHGDSKEKKNTLTNRVVDYLIVKGDFNPRLEKTFTPASVNRLDRNTTGLVIFGKKAIALRDFGKMMRERNYVGKFYTTIVEGEIAAPIDLKGKLSKDVDRNYATVGKEGKEIETRVVPLSANGRYTLVEIELVTGRTHQIRAHLSSIGHPLIGDVKYGGRKVIGLTTQLLHAQRIEFKNMLETFAYLSGKTITAELPDNFKRIKDKLYV